MNAQEKRLLHQNWTFHQVNTDQAFEAQVPGLVHLDLLQHEQIPDPFYANNEDSVQWIEKKDWIYETTFELEQLDTAKEYELVFEGLDTYAEVELNGQNILQADNMFRSWRIDVKSLLQAQKNHLRILFRSPLKVNADKRSGPPYHKTAGNDAGKEKVSVYTRKAPYHFGWDWGPRIVSFGIWRPVYLLEWEKAKFSDIQIYQEALTEEKATLCAEIRLDQKDTGSYHLKVRDLADNEILAEKSAAQDLSIQWTIQNPQRWWPHNLGDPHLYRWQFEVWENDQLLDQKTIAYGLRTIELVQEEDAIGESFYFKVNGEPVFMKGANYIPSDAMLPRRTKEDIDRLLTDAKAVNMNMLRVWGGGIYEDDYFYQKCDELGILLWQDFMFACSMYPADEPFLSNIRSEVEQNVRRLRNHPSIAVWCGNNEIDVAWHNWGWQLRFLISGKNQDKMWEDYQTIFHRTIPDVLKKTDPSRPYTSTSPLSNWGKLRNFNDGTMHFWGVWHGRQPFSDYDIYVGRFMSEYGFQSFPDWATIEAFAPPEERRLESKVMKHHQKSYIGNGMIASHTRTYFQKPRDFQDFVYKSQLTQAIGIGRAIRAHRARKGHCMGTLFWQLNDCWPGPSWSSIDYFGRWKALHHQLMEWYADILIVPIQEHGDLRIKLVSDERKDRRVTLKVTAKNLRGKVLNTAQYELTLPANSASAFADLNWKKFIKWNHRKSTYLDIGLYEEEKKLAGTLHYFVEPRSLRLKSPVVDLKVKGNQVFVTANTLVKDFYLFSGKRDLRFEDNYVDLESGRVYVFEGKGVDAIERGELEYRMVN